MPRLVAVLMSVAFLQTAALAGQDPLTPDQHLEQARQLLSVLSPEQTPTNSAVAALLRDFNEFASAYAAPQTPSQLQVQPAAAQHAEQRIEDDHGAAIVLLERMQALIDGALSGNPVAGAVPVGTSGPTSKAGKVTIERSTLDEIRAEIAQIRLMLGR